MKDHTTSASRRQGITVGVFSFSIFALPLMLVVVRNKLQIGGITMKTCILVVLFTLLALFCSGPIYAEVFQIPDYYPLGQGDRWIYSYKSCDYCNPQYTYEMLSGTQTYNGYQAIKQLFDNGDIELDLNINSPKFTQWPDNYTLFVRDNNNYTLDLHFTSSSSTETYSPYIVVLPAMLSLNDPFTQHYVWTTYYSNGTNPTDDCSDTITLLGIEDVTVQAGVFNNCLKITDSYTCNQGTKSEFTNVATYWLANGVGKVKRMSGSLSSGAVNYYMSEELVAAYTGGSYFGAWTPPTNNCAATLASDLILHVPVATYNGQFYSGDFQWDGGTGIALTNATPLADTSAFSSCTPATVSSDLGIHIPVVMYNGISYWADLQHTQDWNFIVTGVGKN